MVRIAAVPVALVLAQSSLAAPIPFLSDFFDKAGEVIGDAAQAITDPISDFINGGQANVAATSAVGQDEIVGFARLAQFARASFCSAPVVLEWACGEACDANPETQVLLAAGNDEEIPGFFVAFDPPSNSIVVAHQGTNRNSIESIINDIDLFLDPPNELRFPGAGAVGAELHGGFQDTFERTADDVLAFVQAGIADLGATNVIITGHSLGAAIAQLDTMFLAEKLDPSITIQSLLFGLPRVGNEEWSNLFDQTIQARGVKFDFFINDVDPVPRVPPMELGFRHPSGEIFQRNNTLTGGGIETVRCPGQENENCSAGVSIFDADADFHKGPYAGVFLGSKFCTI